MWVSRKKLEKLKKRIAELEKQVYYQQLSIDTIIKVQTNADELIAEFQSSGNSSGDKGSIL